MTDSVPNDNDFVFYEISRMQHNSSYVKTNLHNIGDKPIKLWAVDSAVVKISGMPLVYFII